MYPTAKPSAHTRNPVLHLSPPKPNPTHPRVENPLGAHAEPVPATPPRAQGSRSASPLPVSQCVFFCLRFPPQLTLCLGMNSVATAPPSAPPIPFQTMGRWFCHRQTRYPRAYNETRSVKGAVKMPPPGKNAVVCTLDFHLEYSALTNLTEKPGACQGDKQPQRRSGVEARNLTPSEQRDTLSETPQARVFVRSVPAEPTR